jgi:NADH-ubiquinone oxidoreductase chain 4
MILAGVLLKLGGYGLLRVFPVLFKFGVVWVSLSLDGGLFVSLFCIRQTDLKSLIAYSSVTHTGIIIGDIITLRYWGVCRSFALIVARGLCSSGLFCLSNITYERFGAFTLSFLLFLPSCVYFFYLFSFFCDLVLTIKDKRKAIRVQVWTGPGAPGG